MHATIIEPVITLTGGDARYANVEKAYRAALHELSPGARVGSRPVQVVDIIEAFFVAAAQVAAVATSQI